MATMMMDEVANEADEVRTYKIADEHMGYLTEKLAKVNRKAARLGCGAVEMVTVETKDEVGDDGFSVIRFNMVQIVGERPVLNGYVFAATLQFTEEGVIVRSVPGMTVPIEYRKATPECDHCGFNRRRNETFIVQHVESGEFKQVGRNCLTDFLNGMDANNYASYAELLADLDDEVSSTEKLTGGGGSRFFLLDQYLGYVAQSIEENGWVSRGKAREEEHATATADTALSRMFPFDPKYKPAPPTAEHFARAKAALEWAEENLHGRDDLNDYLHNLKVVTTSQAIDWRMAGIAASLLPLVYRETEKAEREKLPKVESQHMGNEGEKIKFTAKCMGITPCESDFGTSYLHRFVTTEGNVVTTFTKKRLTEQGRTCEMQAKVKKHDTYHGIKQTQVFYAKVLSEIEGE